MNLYVNTYSQWCIPWHSVADSLDRNHPPTPTRNPVSRYSTATISAHASSVVAIPLWMSLIVVLNPGPSHNYP